MLEERNVELRCCARSLPYAQKGVAAIPENYDTEYNDLILNVKVVDGLPEAVEHIKMCIRDRGYADQALFMETAYASLGVDVNHTVLIAGAYLVLGILILWPKALAALRRRKARANA